MKNFKYFISLLFQSTQNQRSFPWASSRGSAWITAAPWCRGQIGWFRTQQRPPLSHSEQRQCQHRVSYQECQELQSRHAPHSRGAWRKDRLLHAAERQMSGQGPRGFYVQRREGERRQAHRVQQDQEVQRNRLRRVQGPGIRAIGK